MQRAELGQRVGVLRTLGVPTQVGLGAFVGFVAVDVEPLALEVDARLGWVAKGDVGGERDDRVTERDFGMALGQIVWVAVANAPGPMLDFLRVAFAGRARFQGELANGRRGTAAFG